MATVLTSTIRWTAKGSDFEIEACAEVGGECSRFCTKWWEIWRAGRDKTTNMYVIEIPL